MNSGSKLASNHQSPSSEESRAPSLTRLPNELILQILGLLSPIDLFRLSLLSRKLNFLALPIFLSAYGTPDPSRRVDFRVTNSGFDACVFHGITAAIFVTSIQELRCRLGTEPNYDQSTELLCGKINRVYPLIERLTSVESVTIEFGSQIGPSATRNLFPDWPSINDRPFGAICKYLSILLDVILKKNCNALVIAGSHIPLENAYRVCHRNSRVINSLSTAQHLLIRGWQSPEALSFGSPGRIYTRNGGTAKLVVHASPEALDGAKRTLRSLSLHSPLFFTPPCLCWTIEVLKAAPITSLSLPSIAIDTSWEYILSLISEAVGMHLTRLTIVGIMKGAETDDILAFLCNLPHLEHLDLPRGLPFIPHRWRKGSLTFIRKEPPMPALRNVQFLSAPLGWIIHFFGIPLSSLPQGVQVVQFEKRQLVLPELQVLKVLFYLGEKLFEPKSGREITPYFPKAFEVIMAVIKAQPRRRDVEVSVGKDTTVVPCHV